MKTHIFFRWLCGIFLSCLFLWIPFVSADSSSVVILSEIAWMGTEISSNDEWVELYNGSDQEIDLSGWRLTADDGTPDVELSGVVGASSYFLLERTDDESVSGVSADMIYTGSLSNSGEGLGLYDADGVQMDYIDSWHAGDNDTKETMQFDSGSWCSGLGTPRAENLCAVEEEVVEEEDDSEEEVIEEESIEEDVQNEEQEKEVESQPSVVFVEIEKEEKVSYDFSRDIVISEVLPNPDGKDSENEFIELKNIGSVDIDLTGWLLDDEAGGGSKPYVLSSQIVAGGYRVFMAKQTRISLKNSGERVRLLDPNGQVIDEVIYGEAESHKSFARKDTGSYEWVSPAPGEENAFFDPMFFRSGRVTKVVDGDTLEIDFAGEVVPVRLIGVDAPELHRKGKEPEFYAQEVYSYLQGLLFGKKVELEFDREKYDTYDRLLGYVSVDGRSVNEELLTLGYVRLYDKYPFERLRAYREAEAYARDAFVGQWRVLDDSLSVVQEKERVEVVKDDMDMFPAVMTHYASGDVRFIEIVANPSGKDDGVEYFVLENTLSSRVSLENWKVSVHGKVRAFDDVFLGASEMRMFTSNDLAFTLRNSGAEVLLIAPDGEIVDRVSYGGMDDDERYVLDPQSGEWSVIVPQGSSSEVAGDSDDGDVIDTFLETDLLGGIEMSMDVISRARIVDVSHVSQGYVGIVSDDVCSDLFFQPDKQSSRLLEMIYRQQGLVSFELQCFGSVCSLSRILMAE